MEKSSVTLESLEDKGVKRFGEGEVVTVIKPEEPSPLNSSLVFGSTPTPRKSQTCGTTFCSQAIRKLSDGPIWPPECETNHPDCKCNENVHILEGKIISKSSSGDIGRVIRERELELEQEFKQQLNNEIAALKERFDYILQNEEMRTAYMMREARRECYEKIRALQNQLECKNAANLMYVMASERRKGKVAMLKMKEEYTNYITALKTLLIEGQDIILHLSRGYKTAARVDAEWREKMKTVLKENYVMKFLGTDDATQCQYYFNEPQTLTIKAPTKISPKEDPCEDKVLEPLDERERPWWERLGDGNERPFVVYGDIGEFKPPDRREVLHQVRLNKNKMAPKTWKEYVFNDMFIKAECDNWEELKDKYRGVPVVPTVCLDVFNLPATDTASSWIDSISPNHNHDHCNRKALLSIDTNKANMGSILKLITATCTGSEPVTKAVLLGAKDSVELASQARMKEKRTDSHASKPSESVKLNVGNRRMSTIQQLSEEIQEYEYLKPPSSGHLFSSSQVPHSSDSTKATAKRPSNVKEADDSLLDMPTSLLGSLHRDSIEVVHHVPDADSKMGQEKYCPVDECKLMQMDSFVRGLPSYMKASPYMIYEQSFDDYEPCSPEQLKFLKEKLEAKAQRASRKSVCAAMMREDPLKEWEEDHNIGTQTSWSNEDLPIPCSCPMPSPTPQTLDYPGFVYNAADLMSVKQLIDHVTFDCLYDNHIERNRFELVGEKLEEYDRRRVKDHCQNTADRVKDIKRILEENPSLLSIFQGNTY